MDSSFLTFSPKALSRKKCNIVQRSTRSRLQKSKINPLQDVHCSPSNLFNIEKNQGISIGSRNKSSNTIVFDDPVEVLSVSTKKVGKSVSPCIPKIDSSKQNCSAKNSTLTFKHVKDNEPPSSDGDKLEEIRNWLNELHTAHERKKYSPPWSRVNTSSVLEVSPSSHIPKFGSVSSPKWRIPETRESIGSGNKSLNTIVLDDSVEVLNVSTKKVGKGVSSCNSKIDSSKQNCSAKNSTLTFKHVKDNEPQSSDNDKFEEIRNWLNELHTAHERKKYSPPWSTVNTSSVLEVSPTSYTPELDTSSSKWRIPETSSDESMESWKQKMKPRPVSNVKISKSVRKAPSIGRISESSDDKIMITARRNKICVINDSASTDARSDQSQLSTVRNKNADVVSDSSSKESSKISLHVSRNSGNSKCHGSTKNTSSNNSVSDCSADRILSTLYGENWDKASVLSPVVQKRKIIKKKPVPKDDPTSIVSTLSEYYGSSWDKEKVLTPLVNRRKITKGKENTPPIVGKTFNERDHGTPKSKVINTIGKSTPKFCSPTRRVSKNASPQGPWSFLRSLSTCSPRRCDHEALLYKKEFKKRKGELCTHLFKLFNAEVFENKLPFNLRIDWNARMIKTAGFCYYQTIHGSQGKIRTSRIELSTKVCTTADRVRDTLIHELCHAAVWIVSGYKAGHGAEWKAWTKKAKKRFPELPGIERCHSYNIEKKYMYKCKNCGYSFGRHSKSLDLQRKRCGYCYGSFELLVNIKPRNADAGVQSTPRSVRAASGFALYVKENYKATKEKNSGLKHAEIMKLLGNQFAGMKVKPNQ